MTLPVIYELEMPVTSEKGQKSKTRRLQLDLALPKVKKGKQAREHGGEKHAKLRCRKTVRPFDPGKPMHITMRSSMAVHERSMLHPTRARVIKDIVCRAARRRGIVIRKYVCVGNHLHLLIQTKARRMVQARPALRAFLREVSGLVARVMTGAQKGRPAKQRFWDYLAWSRIVEWGRDLVGLKHYFTKNEYDALLVLERENWPDVTLPDTSAAPD